MLITIINKQFKIIKLNIQYIIKSLDNFSIISNILNKKPNIIFLITIKESISNSVFLNKIIYFLILKC